MRQRQTELITIIYRNTSLYQQFMYQSKSQLVPDLRRKIKQSSHLLDVTAKMVHLSNLIYFGPAAQIGPRPPLFFEVSRRHTIRHTYKHTRQVSSERVTSLSQRPVPGDEHPCSCIIRTRNLRNHVATELCLRQHGHRATPPVSYVPIFIACETSHYVISSFFISVSSACRDESLQLTRVQNPFSFVTNDKT